MMYRVLDNVLCDPGPKVNVKGQIIYFFLNAFLGKRKKRV